MAQAPTSPVCNYLIVKDFARSFPGGARRDKGSMSENLWDEVLARVEGKINRHSFATWFRPTSFLSDDGADPADRRTERSVSRVAEQELPGRAAGGAGGGRARRGARRLRGAAGRPSTCERTHGTAGRTRLLPPQPQVHLRELRRRLLEPVRPRRRPRGRRDPLEVLQPALHLRRRGARQDPSHARDRPLHPGA